jgi:hypothetical protein
MLVACRLAGLSALAGTVQGSEWARNSDRGIALDEASTPTTYAPTPARRSSTDRHAWKTYMLGCRSERRFGP